MIRRSPNLALRLSLAMLLCACADVDQISFELPADEAEPSTPVRLEGAPQLRSPFATSAYVSSHVTHHSGGGLVDYACRGISRAGHRGTDFAVPSGTPLFASAAGRVIESFDGCPVGNWSCGGSFGNHLIILHAGGRATLYAHLQAGSGLPRIGASVSCGQRIGASGNSGRSTGPHLHYEVRDGVRDVGSYYGGASIRDPYGGRCSSQQEPLWTDRTPGPTCNGASAEPHDDATFVSALQSSTTPGRVGQPIRQQWTLRNTGSKPWVREEGYQLQFTSGTDFGAAEALPLPVAQVPPGQTATFELTGEVPGPTGLRRGAWRMAIAGDGLFGDEVFLSVDASDPVNPRGCMSETLGREVPDGECVQTHLSSCGASSCAWLVCNDGGFVCTDPSACGEVRHESAACATTESCEEAPSCASCTARSGCAWSASRSVCVSEASDGAHDRTSDPAVCGACQETGEVCRADEDCCGSSEGGTERCILGFCTETAGCGLVGAGCSASSACCGAIVCAPDTTEEQTCCLRDSDRCNNDSDCCGQMQCADGSCACREQGETCASTVDCCGGMFCGEDGVCGYD